MSSIEQRILELEMDAEASWVFNDVNLTMVMIVLFFASVFATMISSAKVFEQTSTSATSETTKNQLTEASSLLYYGEIGFPKASDTRGLPTKEAFNDDLLLIQAEEAGTGLFGNKVWEFQDVDIFRDRHNFTINLTKQGSFIHEDKSFSLQELKDHINEISKTKNVFVRLIVDKDTPIKLYEQARSNLWNETEAIHWKFITQ